MRHKRKSKAEQIKTKDFQQGRGRLLIIPTGPEGFVTFGGLMDEMVFEFLSLMELFTGVGER